MTQVGESVFVPQPPRQEKERDEPVQEIKVRVMLFFDGTLNNRTNVEQREKQTEVYEQHQGVGSYENGRSNIALLESLVTEDSEGYDAVVSVYTEGAGTEDFQEDRTLGYALGVASTGVRRKTEKGISTVVTQLEKKLSSQTEKFVLKTVDVDCFGFSRGAATARYCIHQLTDEGGEPLQERLEDRQLPTEAVTINFVGLFDTVSSHGLFFFNDVAALKLDAIHQANKVIQLEAAEEYRRNFSLTTIKSAGGKGKRICLPGAHSDVGGGYIDGPEDQIVFVGTREELLSDYRWLKEHGWYREDQLEVIPSRRPHRHKIRARRNHISNTYARIPLDIMRQFMEQALLVLDPRELPRLIALPSKDYELKELKQRIMNTIDTSDISNPRIWRVQDPLLCSVRNRYFHMSARDDLGMTPRFKDGRRVRKYYEG